ncbi:uncharacterized protein AAG666_022190 [Megaptera novaeangliae]
MNRRGQNSVLSGQGLINTSPQGRAATRPRALASEAKPSRDCRLGWESHPGVPGGRTPPPIPRHAPQGNFPSKGAEGSRSRKPWRARDFPIPRLPASPLSPPPRGPPGSASTQPGSRPPPAGWGRSSLALPPGPSHRLFRPSSPGSRVLRRRFNPRRDPERRGPLAPSLRTPWQPSPGPGCVRAAGTSPGRPRRADWACSGAGRPGAAGAERMPSRGGTPAVQGRHAQAAAVADALASLGRTRARMASLTAYDKDISSGSYNLSSPTTGSYYSCVSQITIGYDVAGPVAVGLTHWKNPYAQGRPTLPSDLPLFVSKDAGIPVYQQSLTRKTELATPLSCPASLSITPVPSYSSSSQETLSQDTADRVLRDEGLVGVIQCVIPVLEINY